MNNCNEYTKPTVSLLLCVLLALVFLVSCSGVAVAAVLDGNYVANVTVNASGNVYAGNSPSLTWSASSGAVFTEHVSIDNTSIDDAQYVYVSSAEVSGTNPKTYVLHDLRGSLISLTEANKVSSALYIDFEDIWKYNVPLNKLNFASDCVSATLSNDESSSSIPGQIYSKNSVLNLNGFILPLRAETPVKVVFDANGGSVEIPYKYVYTVYGELPKPSKVNEVFEGWYTNPEFTGDPVRSDTPIITTTEHTLYAKWRDASNIMYFIPGTGQSLSTGIIGTENISTSVVFPDELIGKAFTWTSGPVITHNGDDGSAQTFKDQEFGRLYEQYDNPHSAETHSSGLGYSFSKLTNQTVLVSQHGVGGYTYQGLKKGKQPYKNLLNAVTRATELASELDMRVVVPGITVVHGESDLMYNTSEAEYMADLAEWQRDFDADIKAITHQTEDVKLYVTQTSASGYGNGYGGYWRDQAVTADAVMNASLTNPNIIFSNPQYQYIYTGVHLYAEGYRLNGEYLGNTIALDFLGRELNTIYPMKIALNSAKDCINVTFHTGAGHQLQFETTNVKDIKNHGFRLMYHNLSAITDPSNSDYEGWVAAPDISITDVSVSGNVVSLKLNTTLENTDNIYLSYASARYGTEWTWGKGSSTTVPDTLRGNLADDSNIGISYPWDSDNRLGLTTDEYLDKNYPAGLPNYAGIFNLPVGYDRTTENAITVTFNYNDGSTPSVTRTVTYGDTYTLPEEPTRAGYTFLGWYTSPWVYAVAPEITENTYVTRADNHGLYARWVRGSYKFGEGEVITEPGEATYGVTNYTAVSGGSYIKSVATNPVPVITVISDGNGTITNTSGSIVYGSSPKYVITPDAGYKIKDVKVNGKSVGNVSSYTFTPVTFSQSIEVIFMLGTVDFFADENGTADFSSYDERWLPRYAESPVSVEILNITGLKPSSPVSYPTANLSVEPPVVDEGYTGFSVVSIFNLNATKALDGNTANITFKVADIGGYSLDNLYVKHWNGTSWENQEKISSDFTNNTLTTATTGFSPFALVGQCPEGTGALQFNLTSGSGFVEDGGRYYLDADTVANISVYLKYNLTKMGRTIDDSVEANAFNFTAVSNFTVTDQVKGVTYVPDTSRQWGNLSSLEMSGNTLRLSGIITTTALPFDETEGEVFLGNLSITAPSSWSNWSDTETPLNVTIHDALTTNGEGACIVYAGASIDAEDITSILSVSAPDAAFSFYPLSHVITNSTENGNVTANKTKSPAGAIIHVDATPDTGYHFVSWNVTNSTGGQITVYGSGNFVMPAENVNAGAEFAPDLGLELVSYNGWVKGMNPSKTGVGDYLKDAITGQNISDPNTGDEYLTKSADENKGFNASIAGKVVYNLSGYSSGDYGLYSPKLYTTNGQYLNLTRGSIQAYNAGDAPIGDSVAFNCSLLSQDVDGKYIFNDTHFSQPTAAYYLITFDGRLLGDVNFDGEVLASDASYVSMYVVTLRSMNEEQLFYGDFNQDETVGASDASKISQKIVGLCNYYWV